MMTDDIVSGGQVIEDRGQCSGLLTVCCQSSEAGERGQDNIIIMIIIMRHLLH